MYRLSWVLLVACMVMIVSMFFIQFSVHLWHVVVGVVLHIDFAVD